MELYAFWNGNNIKLPIPSMLNVKEEDWIDREKIQKSVNTINVIIVLCLIKNSTDCP
jgi:hypothetical protein